MNPSLAMQQTALLDLLHSHTINSVANYADFIRENGLFSSKNLATELRGLRAYRANAQALSASALQASYPVLQQLMGEENFQHLAQDAWQARPPERGDLAQWGGMLPAYLQQVPQLQALLREHPFLPDVARVEWALHEAATAADADLDAASFQWLASQDPAQLRLLLSPGCTVLPSIYPVVSLIQLHDPRASALHEGARAAIAASEPQTALIWRQGLRPMLSGADAASATLVEAALQGLPLSTALDAALALSADFDFSAWLRESVQTGLLIGVAWMPTSAA